MTLRGDRVVDFPINNSLESQNTDSQCNPEPQPEKKKKKKSRKNNSSTLSIGTDSCHSSVITINAETDTKTAALPVLSSNNNSLESYNKDSQCNPEAQPEKRKKKRRKNKDTTIDIHVDSSTVKEASIGTNSNWDSLSDVNGQTDINTTSAPIFSRNNNISESCNIDSHCNPEAECPQPKKKKRKRKLKDNDTSDDIHGETSMVKGDSIGTNACCNSLAEITAQEFGTSALPVLSRNNNSLEPQDIDSHCNPEAECPQPKKKKRKKKLKDKDALNDIHGDTSMWKDDSTEMNTGHDSLADINAAPEFEIAEFPVLGRNSNNSESREENSQFNLEAECSQEIKKKKKRKPKYKDASIDSHVGASELKDDSPVTNSCHDSLAEIDAQTDLRTDKLPVVTSPCSDIEIIDYKTASLPVLSRKNNSLEAHNIDSQSNSEAICSQPIKKKRKPKDKDASIDSHVNASKLKLKDVPDVTNSCHDSLVKVNTQTDMEVGALLVLSRSERKRMRKKQKLDSFATNDSAHCPRADLDVVGMEDGLLSEKQNDPRSKSVNKVENHDKNDEGAFNLNGNENVKRKKGLDKAKLGASVKNEKAHIPPVNEIDCQSSPITNQGAVHIIGGNESTKTSHIEEKSRSHSKKRRKSAETKENMQPITVAGRVSSDSDRLHLTKISSDEMEVIQAGKVAPSINVEGIVLAEKISDCSNGDFPCSGSKKIFEMKKSSGLNISIENHNVKKLLILDVNGLLVDVVPKPDRQLKHDLVVSKKYVYKRPFCDDFLQFCLEKFSVGIWSSRLKMNLDKILDFLMADTRRKLLFCWDQSHCTNTGFTITKYNTKPLFLKELKKVWDKLEQYNETNTLLLDDSPYKALTNPANTAIFPRSYNHKNAEDSSLGPGGDLRMYLEKLADAPNVQEYVACNPFGQKAITKPSAFHQKVLSSLSRRRNTSSSKHSYIGNS